MPETTTPDPPPEAITIRRARLAQRMTVQDAARAADISVARWNQVEAGYDGRRDRCHARAAIR
jgi:transcriptional regulator with XRE-family HTH domain